MKTNQIPNTFGIPCEADCFAEYASEEELRSLLSVHRGIRLLHVGGGSNLLFLHPRFNGVVLHNAIRSLQVLEEGADQVLLRVGGGLVWDDFVAACLSRGWYGLENLSLIPGEVGASAVQNVGAYGAEAGEFIEAVECLNLRTLQPRHFTHDECQYGYRHSLFKTDGHRGQWAVLYVHYRLSRHFTPRLDYGGIRLELERRHVDVGSLTASQLRETIISIREHKLPDPRRQGSAGSFFKNPVVPRARYEALAARFPDMPHYDVGTDEVKIPAGWLIEQCGWKGRSLGQAAVHERQALVLVNLGHATGQDILALCQAIQHDVSLRFGIQLQPEVNFIE